MPQVNQKGIAHIFILLLLVAGIGLAVYLVGQKTNLLPHAQQAEPNLSPQTAFYLFNDASPSKNIDLANEQAGSNTVIPNRNWFYPGEEIRVNVAVSTDIENANTFSAVVSYPADLLEVTSIIKGTIPLPVKGNPKLDSHISGLIAGSPSDRDRIIKDYGISLKGNKILVELRVAKTGLTAADLQYQENGFEETGRYEILIDGYADLDKLIKMADNPNISYIGLILPGNYNLQGGGTGTTNATSIQNTTTSAVGRICAQVITRACHTVYNDCKSTPETGCDAWYSKEECKDFPTPCDVPEGWVIETDSGDLKTRVLSCQAKGGTWDFNTNQCLPPHPKVGCETDADCKDGRTCQDNMMGCQSRDPNSICNAKKICLPPAPASSCRPRPACLDNPDTITLSGCEIATSDMCPPLPKQDGDYFIRFWLPDTGFDNQTGRVTLSGGVTGAGIKTSPPNKPIMATIVFKAKQVGEAKLDFGDQSLILSNASSANILAGKYGLALQIQDPTKPVIKGDLDGDEVVGFKDFSILLTKWGTTDKIADINGDGKVNIFDFSLLISNWTK